MVRWLDADLCIALLADCASQSSPATVLADDTCP